MDSLFGIGGTELVIILILAAIVLGPERLVRSAHDLGKFIHTAKNYFETLSSELKSELQILDELEKVKRDLPK